MMISKKVSETVREVIELLDPYFHLKKLISFNDKGINFKDQEVVFNGKIYLFGLGKASSFELEAFYQLLKENDLENKIEKIVSYTKEGATVDCENFIELEGTHPVVSERNIENTKKYIQLLEEISKEDTLIFFLSGGASALLELPVEGLSFEQLKLKHEQLLLSGININEMNKKRKEISLVKNGGLLKYIKTKNIIQFVTCDIPNENLSDVGSGPLLNDTRIDENPYTIKSQSASLLLERLCERDSKRIRDKIYDCSFEELIESVERKLPLGDDILISGGEAPVEVTKFEGRGGRNTHFVLSLANRIYSKEENRNIHILSFGTDGGDGNTNVAGAYINFDLFSTLDPKEYLEEFNSFEYFEKINGLVITGVTKTNVMDLRCIWRE
ncbi:DUF4147 domain-containing protein [Halobacteriovorax sp. GB3]|uniref:DUF4147 domain-containing protein n=1 Tax=Halobacteriovorax sp. GB3 TaxID=2719615 RepID=UPI00235DD966|nr:DUF4147 domain-containing protein [Halobacteriovorax sp. GB3]MDD0854332.1 DUF4147 domain-containing protein [Halobacteriovorax sp. GB3]